MIIQSNNWDAVRAFYDEEGPKIMAGPSNEWAIDAYAWDDAGISMTPIERWLWQDIREANVVMYPQWPVAGFFVDFANPVAKVAIECDGREYHLDKEKDGRRDAKLAALGWTVYRITGADCREDFDEETMAPGAGRQLVDLIAGNHKVKRGR